MEVLSLFNADSCPKSNVDVVKDLGRYPELIERVKWKCPIFDNYYDAKDIIMKVLEENDNIIAGLIIRRKKKSVVYFRKTQPGETNYGCFLRLVDKIKDDKKGQDLFIKVVIV